MPLKGPTRMGVSIACKTGQPLAVRFGASKSQVVQAVQDVRFLQISAPAVLYISCLAPEFLQGWVPVPRALWSGPTESGTSRG